MPVDRRQFLAAPVAWAALPLLAVAQDGPAVELVTSPRRVFKIPDYGKEDTEAWIFSLVVQTGDASPMVVESLRIDYQAGDRPVKSEILAPRDPTPALRPAAADMNGHPLPAPLYRPLFHRVRGKEERASDVDLAVITLRGRLADVAFERSLRVPITRYTPHNAFTSPVRGPLLIKASQAIDGGHRNRSGQFAFDIFPLTPSYGVLVGASAERNEDLAGYGRDVLAPAAGVVVSAITDRPDQPRPGVNDEALYNPVYASGGDVGNSIVLDHGHGEFSMIAHLKPGSVAVRVGDRVEQGQVVGQIGNSGDTTAPHLHYQLQDGPDWRYSDALPVSFSDIPQNLYRGDLVETR